MKCSISADDLQIRLGETDPIRSILQNVAIILRTRQGTCPMYREFGMPQNYMDKPIPVAKPLMYAEIREAVEAFEPRCSVIGVTFMKSDLRGIIPVVEVEIHEQIS